MNVNRHGIIVAAANGFNHSKSRKVIPTKKTRKGPEIKTFVSLFKECPDAANQHIMQPYNEKEISQLTNDGWKVEDIWDRNEIKELYVANESEHV